MKVKLYNVFQMFWSVVFTPVYTDTQVTSIKDAILSRSSVCLYSFFYKCLLNIRDLVHLN